jgi:hypothetical protein
VEAIHVGTRDGVGGDGGRGGSRKEVLYRALKR